MSRLRKVLQAGVLALAVGITVTMGAVFPVPPLVIMARRRRTDRTEVVMPAAPGARLDLQSNTLPASLLSD